MKKITIKAINQKGEKAIKQHWKESKKIKLHQKLVFKAAGYKHELISKNPYTILLTIGNKHAKNPTFLDLILGEITKSINENGATKEDYSLEVENE